MIKLKFNLALLILIPTIGFSQVNDTIELPIKKAIILVFKDKPVFQTGFANIVPSVQENKLIIRYGYPNTKKKTFEETNLFVQAGDEYFMFIIKHSETPKKYIFNYTLPDSTKMDLVDYSIKTKKETQLRKQKAIDSLHLQNCQTIDYKDQECFDKGIESKKMKVDLVLPNYNVQGDYFYFKFVVKNRSRIDYKLNTFKFIVQSRENGVTDGVVAFEELKPIYFYNESNKNVAAKSNQVFVLVFEKFTIDQDKKIIVTALEQSGERTLEFDFFAKDLNKIKNL